MSDEFSPAVIKAMETFQTGLKMTQEIRRLKEENERLREILCYVRKACKWTGSEAMIVMSIHDKVAKFDAS